MNTSKDRYKLARMTPTLREFLNGELEYHMDIWKHHRDFWRREDAYDLLMPAVATMAFAAAFKDKDSIMPDPFMIVIATATIAASIWYTQRVFESRRYSNAVYDTAKKFRKQLSRIKNGQHAPLNVQDYIENKTQRTFKRKFFGIPYKRGLPLTTEALPYLEHVDRMRTHPQETQSPDAPALKLAPPRP